MKFFNDISILMRINLFVYYFFNLFKNIEKEICLKFRFNEIKKFCLLNFNLYKNLLMEFFMQIKKEGYAFLI